MAPTYAHELRTLTWNMQGANSAGGQSKWSQLQTELEKSAKSSNTVIDIVSLQECGGVPENDAKIQIVKRELLVRADAIDTMPAIRKPSDYVPLSGLQSDDGPYLTVHDPNFGSNDRKGSGLSNVKEYKWSMGTTLRPIITYYIYHYSLNIQNTNTNAQNLRTNLAIVSTNRAEEVIVFMENQTFNRPVLGIRLGLSYFFSMHAPAFGNNPSPQMVTDIEKYIGGLEHENRSWIIMGDFNREPSTLKFTQQYEITRQVIQPEGSTQRSGKKLDYAVVGAFMAFGRVLMTATVVSALTYFNTDSDHSAVRFDPKSN